FGLYLSDLTPDKAAYYSVGFGRNGVINQNPLMVRKIPAPRKDLSKKLLTRKLDAFKERSRSLSQGHPQELECRHSYSPEAVSNTDIAGYSSSTRDTRKTLTHLFASLLRWLR